MDNAAYDAELKIPSDLVYLRPVRSFIKELADNTGFCRERVTDIELAVDEVFSNAIEHGSVGSGSCIVIRCLLTDEMMRVTVSDTGHGKGSRKKWLDAWSDAVKEKAQPGTERGHGLFLVRNLTDKVSMESNSAGGVDVHLVVYKEGQRIAHE